MDAPPRQTPAKSRIQDEEDGKRKRGPEPANLDKVEIEDVFLAREV
jgi:hypothetical protein